MISRLVRVIEGSSFLSSLPPLLLLLFLLLPSCPCICLAQSPASNPSAGGVSGIRSGRTITVTSNLDIVAALGSGYGPVGRQINVTVSRGGRVVGQTGGKAKLIHGSPGLEVNHEAGGLPQPGDCWVGRTPHIQPGDHVIVEDDEGRDEIIVDDIAFTGLPEADGNDVIVPFRAIDVLGVAIPLSALNGAQFRAGSDLRFRSNEIRLEPGKDAAGLGAGLMRYVAPFQVARNRNGLNQQQIRQALLTGGTHFIGFEGGDELLAQKGVLVEGHTTGGGPAVGCPPDPAIRDCSADTLNACIQANANSTQRAARVIPGSCPTGVLQLASGSSCVAGCSSGSQCARVSGRDPAVNACGSLSCLDGEWSGTVPNCVLDCQPPSAAPTGTTLGTCTQTLRGDGQTCTLQLQTGQQLQAGSSLTLTCNDGILSPLPATEPVTAPAAPADTSADEAEPQPEPEPQSQPQPQPQQEPEPEPEPQPQPQTQPKPGPQPEPQPQQEPEPEAETEPEPQTQPDPPVQPQPQPDPQTKPQPSPDEQEKEKEKENENENENEPDDQKDEQAKDDQTIDDGNKQEQDKPGNNTQPGDAGSPSPPSRPAPSTPSTLPPSSETPTDSKPETDSGSGSDTNPQVEPTPTGTESDDDLDSLIEDYYRYLYGGSPQPQRPYYHAQPPSRVSDRSPQSQPGAGSSESRHFRPSQRLVCIPVSDMRRWFPMMFEPFNMMDESFAGVWNRPRQGAAGGLNNWARRNAKLKVHANDKAKDGARDQVAQQSGTLQKKAVPRGMVRYEDVFRPLSQLLMSYVDVAAAMHSDAFIKP